MKVLKLTGADEHDFRLQLKIKEGQAKGDLTQYTVMKHFIEHILLGVYPNTTLERVELDFPPWLSGDIKCELLLQCWTSFISAVANGSYLTIVLLYLDGNALLAAQNFDFQNLLYPLFRDREESLSLYAFGTQHA